MVVHLRIYRELTASHEGRCRYPHRSIIYCTRAITSLIRLSMLIQESSDTMLIWIAN
jgi:hypothetical protein